MPNLSDAKEKVTELFYGRLFELNRDEHDAVDDEVTSTDSRLITAAILTLATILEHKDA